MSVLPKGWVEAKLGELGSWQGGGTPDKSNAEYWSSGTIPWISPKDMKRFRISEADDQITEAALAGSSTSLIAENSILIVTRSGILKHTLPVTVTGREVAINQDIKALTPHPELNALFIAQQIKSLGSFVLKNCTKAGTTVDSVDFDRLRSVKVNIPPLAEQKRIVAKLDGLNARSARARTELARIEILVSRYKQAVLSKAFSGELTREWRAAANQSDTIDAVLKFIRSSRRNSPKLARRKAASGVPQAVLPETWRWISPDELASDDPYSIGIGPFGSNLVKGDYRARGVRLVFVRDIRRENFSLENAVFISEAKADELQQHSVTGGDLLVTKMGDPPGDTAIFPNEQAAAVITADCIKVRPHLELTFSKFLYWAIRSNIVKEQILEETKGVAQQKLSLDRFRQIAIPTPPIEEQHEIVRRIESAFAKIDRLAAEARRALNLVGKLDEAILAKAFRGELVPQDENDEPAEKLLERIRAERAAAPKGRRGRGRH